jgi:aspartate aminotransferase-like enzyme
MQREMIPHRGSEFAAFYADLLERLRTIHRTKSDVLVWPASGSAGWEIAVTNLLSPGDQVVALINGDFGDRFARVAIAFGIDVERVEADWGSIVTPDVLEAALDRSPSAKAVFITHNETSTGATHPLAELAAIARDRDLLTIVDAVSSAAGLPLEFDVWELDFVLSGSQKAWMCPPGLVIVAVSERAWRFEERSTFPRFFWDMRAMRRYSETGTTPTTPPISLLYALEAAVSMIEEESLEAVWNRHVALGGHVRRGIKALGLELLTTPGFESNTVTAFLPPAGLSASRIVQSLRREHGITVAAGQGKLTDSIVRIGHMGWCDQDDIDACLWALEQTVTSLAHNDDGRAEISLTS